MPYDNTLRKTALSAAVLILGSTALIHGVSASAVDARTAHATALNDTQCPVNIPGYTHHGDCNLLCGPASWIDVMEFYLGNYVAHAVTIISSPGQSLSMTILKLLSALFFPGAGVSSGILALSSLARWAPTDLQRAARAGALCAVVKTPDRPPRRKQALRLSPQMAWVWERFSLLRRKKDGEQKPQGQDLASRKCEAEAPGAEGIARDQLNVDQDPERGVYPVHQDVPETSVLRPRQEPSSLEAIKIHGRCQLPEGYDLVVVPTDATFENDKPEEQPKLPFFRRQWAKVSSPFLPQKEKHTTLACSYSPIKVIVSIAQLLYAISTLYESRGNQILRYGYAAFGLTVAPYAWMSLVNLVGNLICPQYDAIYIVESSDLDALRQEIDDEEERGGVDARPNFVVDGTVGRLSEDSEKALKETHKESYDFHTLKLLGGIHDSQLSPRRINSLANRGNVSTLNLLFAFMPLLFIYASLVPIAIVGALSRFKNGGSSKYQRVWTMVWLSFGSVGGTALGQILNLPAGAEGDMFTVASGGSTRYSVYTATVGMLAVYSATAIGGYVVVGQMIREYGTCIEIS